MLKIFAARGSSGNANGCPSNFIRPPGPVRACGRPVLIKCLVKNSLARFLRSSAYTGAACVQCGMAAGICWDMQKTAKRSRQKPDGESDPLTCGSGDHHREGRASRSNARGGSAGRYAISHSGLRASRIRREGLRRRENRKHRARGRGQPEFAVSLFRLEGAALRRRDGRGLRRCPVASRRPRTRNSRS